VGFQGQANFERRKTMAWFDLKGKDFISTKDWTKEELDILLDVAADFKRRHYARIPLNSLDKKTYVMLFFNDSTRTRHSFETAMTQLGGHAQYVNPGNMRLTLDPNPTGKGESIKDTAEVLSRFVDGIGIRLLTRSVPEFGRATEIIQAFAKYASIPVINMMSDIWHPCQAMADLMTMKEKVGDLRGKKLVVTWAYSNQLRDWASTQEAAILAARYGMEVTVAHPPEYTFTPGVFDLGKEYAAMNGTEFREVEDFDEALKDADVVYPRVWVTMDYHMHSQEEELTIAGKYRDWQFTREKRDKLTNHAHMIHCMPIDRDSEASSDLIDDPEVSWLYDEAENRLHLQKAVLAVTMGGRF
jgi:N-acetylornithine carbamoyltransferase